jgi:hypothetical protein
MPRTRSEPRRKATEPLSFADWHRQAVGSIDRMYAARIGRVAHRQWTRWYVSGLTPDDAARAAERDLWNAMTPAERMRQK